MKQIFLTFSSKIIGSELEKNLVEAIENNPDLKISYRWFDQNQNLDPSQIYEKSLQEIRNCDIFIAESTNGSTGVGQQISYALAQKKPTIILLDKSFNEANKSLFLKGLKSPNYQIEYYKNKEELSSILTLISQKFQMDRLQKFNFISTAKTNDILEKESLKKGISKSELLRQIISEWIKKNELD
jgi:nucleoside 2-deoxyribosyltransferase